MKKIGKIILGVIVGILVAGVVLAVSIKVFNIPAIHFHSVVKDEAVAATCTASGLTEGKHCSTCEEILKPQDVIPALGHSYDDDGVCTRCSHVRTLSYGLNADGASYTVIGIGEVVSRTVIIPSEYNGLPITGVRAYAFENTRFMRKVVIPASVKAIGAYAFKGCDNLEHIFCEATEEPSDWNSKWDRETGSPSTIYWGGWEYNSNGEPEKIGIRIELPYVPLGVYDTDDWFYIG